jgi:transposase
MATENVLLKKFILPELKVTNIQKISNSKFFIYCEKKTTWEVCHKCPTKSYSVHDHRTVKIKDAKLRGKHIILVIKKRRFRCPNCKSVFTESIHGIKVKHRTTENYKSSLLYNYTRFENTTQVARDIKCSTTYVHTTVNKRLELELRESKNTAWGPTVLIDEHSLGRNKKTGRREFVTCFIDNKRKCLREMALGRSFGDLTKAINYIPGRENVKNIVIDMHAGYKSFIQEYFPNANITVDKFHVIKLIHPAIRKYRKQVTGDRRTNPIKNLLLKNKKN